MMTPIRLVACGKFATTSPLDAVAGEPQFCYSDSGSVVQRQEEAKSNQRVSCHIDTSDLLAVPLLTQYRLTQRP
jgi:hypothetical protein